ncbi:Elongation of very long chain fatty acids protein [Dirofilaria immitis]|nr:Elongation of very long chain fatty acids protein [Dirofilaria immitis]
MDEKQMDYDAQLSIEWMEQHRPLFMILIIAYALFVINMPRIWKGRGNRDLALIIFYWNAFNALMDIILLLSLLPEFLSSFHEGFYSSLCLSAGLYKNSKSGKAILIFHISKIWELLDTILMILDGRKTNTLHVVHHIVISTSMIYSYQRIGALARWIAITNLAAHSTLYFYLAAQSCVWKRRTCSARVIGSIQIAQFPICLFGLFKIRQFLNAKKKCETNYNGPCIKRAKPIGKTGSIFSRYGDIMAIGKRL